MGGAGGVDILNGAGRNDHLSGGGGNDTANGGAGNDVIEGGDGNDVLHGNAGNALDRVHYIDAFGDLGDGRLWEVYLFEYPGYGARAGKISEKSFRQAGAAALRGMLRQFGLPQA